MAAAKNDLIVSCGCLLTWAGHRRLPLAGDPRRGGWQAGPGAHDAGPCRRPLSQETARLPFTVYSSELWTKEL
jgi:hypothetical protein